MIRFELLLDGGRVRHAHAETFEEAALRVLDIDGSAVIVAWRQCQCQRVEVLGDARRIIEGSGRGFMLVEAMLALALVGFVSLAMVTTLVPLLRVSAQTERAVERVGFAETAVSIAERVSMSDPCDASEVVDEVRDRLGAFDHVDLDVLADCETPDLVVYEVTATDSHGQSTVVAGSRVLP